METYTHGPDLSGSLEGAGGIGGILAERSNGTTRWYHADVMGNINLMSTASRTISARLTYDPFGQVLEQTGPTPRYQFSSKEYDTAAGLNYYGYRFYSPGQGRWLSRDPLGEFGGVNQYGIVRNNPLLYVDELGLIYGIGNPVSGPNGPVGPSDPYGPNPWAPTPPPPPGFHWYGNWGGPGWANGGWNPESGCLPDPGDPDYVPPIDERDACYEGHDRCINGCPECPKDARSDCIEGCDHDLADCLYDLGNPWLWPEASSFDTWIPCFVH